MDSQVDFLNIIDDSNLFDQDIVQALEATMLGMFSECSSNSSSSSNDNSSSSDTHTTSNSNPHCESQEIHPAGKMHTFGQNQVISTTKNTAPTLDKPSCGDVKNCEKGKNRQENDEIPESSKGTKQKKAKAPKLPKNEDAEEKSGLPPCNVCGAKSSGFHFGAITCEPCKVFFRRSLGKNPTVYSCSRKENCEMLPGRRANCSFCRLKKCVALGMSKDGVKKGRYTLERKKDFLDIAEKLEQEEKLQQINEQQEKENDKKLITDTIERLKLLNDKHRIVTPEVVAKVKMAEQEKRTYLKSVEDIVGHASAPTHEEVTEIFQNTGIDITGFGDAVKECHSRCPPTFVARFVAYATDLEEYMSLTLVDRITVLKATVYVWLWISSHEMLNTEDYFVTCLSCGLVLAPQQFLQFTTSQDFYDRFKPLKQLKDQNLSDKEKAMLRAFVIFDSSLYNHELEEPEKIDRYQNRFLECLLHVLEESRGKSKAMKVYRTIIQTLTETRRSEKYKQTMMKRCIEIVPDMKYSKLMCEVFDLPDSLVKGLNSDMENLELAPNL